MADNVDVTAGAGTTVATDDIGGVHYQIIKLAAGALDTATLLLAGTGTGAGSLRVNLATDVALPAGTNAIGKLAANSGVDIGDVDVASIAAGDTVIGRVKLSDGTDVADILDLTNSNPLAVAIVDANGDQITSFGGGTQYTEGDTDATITGTAMLMEVASDVVRPVQGTVAAGLLVNLGTNNDVTLLATAAEGAALPAEFVVIAGDDGTDTHPLQLSGTGDLKVSLDGETPGVVLQTGAAVIGDLGSITGTISPGTGATDLGKAEDGAHTSGDVGVMALAVRKDTPADLGADNDYTPLQMAGGRLWTRSIVEGLVADGTTLASASNPILIAGQDGTVLQSIKTDNQGELQVDVLTIPGVAGTVAHDDVDSGNPVKVGLKAIAHGTNPTAVAAADRTDWYANRAGVPFVISGHPNIQTIRVNYTAAQTDTAIISASAGTKIVVTKCSVMADKANTVDVQARIGFGTANTPTGAKVILTHPGIAAGSGVIEGSGAGIIGIGADDEDLRITSEVPTTGSIDVLVTYYTIES